MSKLTIKPREDNLDTSDKSKLVVAERTYTWAETIKTGASEYQTGTLSDLANFITGEGSGYEILTQSVVPYYDFDYYVDVGKPLTKSIIHYDHIIETIENVFPSEKFPNKKIFVFYCYGKIPVKKLTEKGKPTRQVDRKHSFHAIVRGVGAYSCGASVPQISECDTLVYKKRGFQQKFRLPYCDKDGDGRFFQLVTKSKTSLTKHELDVFDEEWLCTNVNNEVLIADPIEEPAKEPTKTPTYTSTTPVSQFKPTSQMSPDQFRDLVLCLVPEGKQEWDREFHRNFIWSMAQAAKELSIDTKELAIEVSKMSEKYGSSKKNSTDKYYDVPPAKYGNKFGVGWICNQVKNFDLKAFKDWRAKYHVCEEVHFFNEYPKLAELPLVSFRELHNWAKSCISVIINGGKSIFMTKCQEVLDPEYPQVKTTIFKPIPIPILYSNTRIHVNYYDNRAVDEEMYNSFSCMFNTLDDDEDVIASTDDNETVEETEKPKKKKAAKPKAEKASKPKKPHPYTNLSNFIKDLAFHNKLPIYGKVDFYPWGVNDKPKESHDTLNLFTGFAGSKFIPTKEIDITTTKFYKHLSEQLTTSPKEFEYLSKWVACLFQRPRDINGAALCFISHQGNGKDTFAELLESLIGSEYYLSCENVDTFFKDFNTDQAGKLLVKMNELSEGGKLSKQHDRYKGELTKKTTRIEPKGIDPFNVRHFGHYIHFTQHKNSITVENTDRRWFIVNCNNEFANVAAYWQAIRKELADPNIRAAWFKFFSQLDVSKFNATEIFETRIKQELKTTQMPNAYRFLVSLVNEPTELVNEEGETVFSQRTEFSFTNPGLYEAYVQYCTEDKEMPVRKAAFLDRLKEIGIEAKPVWKGEKTSRLNNFTTAQLEQALQTYLKMPSYKITEN